jgi:hypothetical protein
MWVGFALDATPDTEIGSRTPITSSGYAHFSSSASRAAFSSLAANATNAISADTAATATNSAQLGGVLPDNYAQAGERLRIVRGVVSQTGQIISGSGFRSRVVAIGQFVVDFTPPFSAPPAVTAAADNGALNQYMMVSTGGVTGSTAFFRTFGGRIAGSEAFHFVAIGPR